LVQASWNVAPSVLSLSGTFFGVFSNTTTMYSVFGITGTAGPKIINSGSAAQPGFYSQPSSNHPGGAVAAFADGHTEFIKDSLEAKVYAQLLSSNDSAVRSVAPYSVWNPDYRVLNEGNYK
jgi:prepilin-type processing-associated H-X9-DG protein